MKGRSTAIHPRQCDALSNTDRLPALRALFQKHRSAASSHDRHLNRTILRIFNGQGPVKGTAPAHAALRPGTALTCRTQRHPKHGHRGQPWRGLGSLCARPLPQGPRSPGPPCCNSPWARRRGRGKRKRCPARGGPGGSAAASERRRPRCGGHGALRAAPELGRAPGRGRARGSDRRRYRRGAAGLGWGCSGLRGARAGGMGLLWGSPGSSRPKPPSASG